MRDESDDRVGLVRAAAAIFLAAHLIAGANPSLWGVDSLHGASVSALMAFAAAALAVLFAPLARIAASLGRRRPGSVTSTALLAAAAATFFALRPSAVPLLGDGLYELRDLARIADSAGWSIRWAGENAPLCTWLRVHGFDALRETGVTPETFLRTMSVMSGIGFVVAAAAFASAIARRGANRSSALALLLTGGFMQLFCGYMETYPMIAPVLVLYLACGARVADGGRILPAALWLGVLVALHFSMLTLVPSLGALAASSTKARGASAAMIRGAAWAGAALAAAAGLLFAIGFDFGAYANVPRDSVAPIAGELGFRDNWHLLSIAHASDVLNQYLLAAPAALLALPLLVSSRRGQEGGDPATSRRCLFLQTAALFPVAFTLVANPEVGAFRDWDVFALPGLALTAWVATFVAGRTRASASTAIIAGACALHTFAWVSLNADAARAEARFERLLGSAPLSRHARSYGWESLASLRRDRGDAEAAAEAWDLAARHAERNARLWNAAADAQLKLNRAARAGEAWSRALEAEPRNADAHFGLGALAFRAQDYAAAARHFEAAVTARPDFALAHYNLGLARLRTNEEAAAIASLSIAVRANPGFALGWETLGAVHRSAGRLDEARGCFERSLAIRPEGPDAERVRGWLQQISGD